LKLHEEGFSALLDGDVLLLLCASGVFGRLTVSTPFLKLASILSVSTPSGTVNDRWNEP
jgi:hypothetical protein